MDDGSLYRNNLPFRSIEKDSKASAKRDYEQEQDESLSSSGKRRRVQHGPAPTKKGDAEGKPRRPLSSSPRNVAARLQREELANSLATLKAELPPYPTNRTQVRVLEDAVGYIQKLKRLYRAGVYLGYVCICMQGGVKVRERRRRARERERLERDQQQQLQQPSSSCTRDVYQPPQQHHHSSHPRDAYLHQQQPPSPSSRPRDDYDQQQQQPPSTSSPTHIFTLPISWRRLFKGNEQVVVFGGYLKLIFEAAVNARLQVTQLARSDTSKDGDQKHASTWLRRASSTSNNVNT
ncbi:hypothetical protein O0I10_011778 [Lichtheimia ornata]|uniref:BHLH domain-containing protein n=1 Tax=Lichtheimia ornata TaxID=688661 RepID=A0AAD7USY2_9FUNG|nr:uncharacterized protein O0I10_011778 [Lichtheimia ornata]KAJ8652573.1 hypothetical protein O0I10_011778 [Lichtheimia ornata]